MMHCMCGMIHSIVVARRCLRITCLVHIATPVCVCVCVWGWVCVTVFILIASILLEIVTAVLGYFINISYYCRCIV